MIRQHSLSLVLAAIWFVLSGASAVPDQGTWFAQILANMAGDAFGALLVVIATKYFIERGSPQSK